MRRMRWISGSAWAATGLGLTLVMPMAWRWGSAIDAAMRCAPPDIAPLQAMLAALALAVVVNAWASRAVKSGTHLAMAICLMVVFGGACKGVPGYLSFRAHQAGCPDGSRRG